MNFKWMKEVIESQFHLYRSEKDIFDMRSTSELNAVTYRFKITPEGVEFIS